MKKVITMLLLWTLFVNGSEKSNSPDEFIIFYEDENSVHKCKREDYLEMMELLEIEPTKEQIKNYYRILYNESVAYTELQKNNSIN